ncbi:MAG: hypothetical protein ACRENL_08830 [Candidatus Dormibacteria bacterium]
MGVLLVVLRRPDAVTNPQFWAEDGSRWFADAYNMGASSLLQSYEGYLVTLPRLVAIPAVHLSLQHAALLFNLVAITIQVAPAALFMSRRFEHLAPRAWVRALIGIVYLLVPSFELNAIITNALWHLAILAVMVLVARPPARLMTRAFDVTVIVLTGLTGPFAALLLPVALARARVLRSARRWYLGVSTALVATLLVQAWAVLHSHRDAAASLGASVNNLLFLISDRVVLPASFAEEAHTHVYTVGQSHGTLLAGLVAILATAVVGLALVKSAGAVRIFLLFCFAITAASLLFPLNAGSSTDPWTVLGTTGAGDRYFLSAEVAWLVCVIWVLSRLRRPIVRWGAGLVTAACFASGLASQPQYPPFADLHLATYDAQLRAAAPGTVVVVPSNPSERWALELRRRR